MSRHLIVVMGPTASGKSDLAIKLALRLGSGQAKKLGIKGAEIISADSRQVYRGMDIGTGKVTKKEMCNIPHYLLDVASPKRRFTVVQYRKLALLAINKIFVTNKVPILCGGTGFYIQAVVDGLVIPEVKPDRLLRSGLDRFSTEELFEKLKRLDSRRAKNIDKYNRRRLIRALEIVIKTKKPVPALKKSPLPYPVLLIGIKKTPEELQKLIKKRLLKRLKTGVVEEVKKLHRNGVSWKRLEEFGLEYRWIARYLQLNVTRSVLVTSLQKDIEHFAKRQMTWFKRDKRIHWVQNYKEARELMLGFVNPTL